MFNPGNNNPYGGGFGGGGFGGRRGAFASRYQYQQAAPGYANTETASSLISKVMGMLAFAFVFAFLGAIVGVAISLTFNTYIFVAIAGFVVLLILNFTMNRSPGLSLFLLYLFTFIEGLALAPLISLYIAVGYTYILAEAFLITAVTSFGLAAYAWTTKRDFSGIGSKLFVGLIILLVASLVSFFFHSTILVFLICVAGVGLFSMYLIYYVQRARFMADTLPNAIGLTVSIFITVLNLFIYILYILTILQGGNRGGRR